MNDSRKVPLTEEQEQNAALAALGFLSPREAAALPREAIGQMREAAALLAESIPAVAPAPAIKSRLMARIAQFQSIRPLADVRRDEDLWRHFGAPGVDIKPLFKDPATGRSTVLLRMEPGARIPAHRHHDVEQCLVVKGDIRFGDVVYEEGDFVVMDKDTDHPEIYSVNGNLLLLIAGDNEHTHA